MNAKHLAKRYSQYLAKRYAKRYAKHLARRAALCAIMSAAAFAAFGATADPGLRVGVLPDVDSLPLLVADALGYFSAEGARVELLPFKTAVERDAALQAGAIDGAVSDLLAVALAAQAGFDIKATSLTDGRYGLVASPVSRVSSLAGLAGVPVGVSSNTVIQFAAETMLRKAGVAAEGIRSLAVPKIQLRMELLLAGQLEAACLPEPLLGVAVAKGARLLAASDDSGLGAGVIVFSRAAREGRMADIAAFYRAYKRAAEAIDAKPDSFRAFLVDKAGFPEEARTALRFVAYKTPRLPSDADIAGVLSWMGSKGLLSKPLSPKDLLDGDALAEAAKGW